VEVSTAPRFIESVLSQTLYFPSARQFEDPFEGAVAVLPHDWPIDPRYGGFENGDKAFEELRRLTKISFWHCANYESDAMWKLYVASRQGPERAETERVAIRDVCAAAGLGARLRTSTLLGRPRYT
jgi:hypothetical protein